MKYLVMLSLLVTTLFSSSAFAKKQKCYVTYFLDGSTAPAHSKELYLGKVGGFLKSKRKACMKLAKKSSNVKKAVGSKLPKVTAAHCKSGMRVKAKIDVGNRNKDGEEFFTMKPAKCNYAKKCVEYHRVFASGSFK